ncbi:unnamed protein product [Parascedosporium putredinis]|uniref:ER membrane protein complex subunit 4 n=1 Tax=Parascedosporium putredinis TaxID=1442378 RepID=A0A9P1H065_9PEZI|nr:unnamed protein product [Parascedosporium putredinis]CAI7991510.1 unnamed protein product [Parascedosporium putredinis]
MWQNKAELPKWIADLNNPPLPKSKAAGVVDPPGFPSQTSTKKSNASRDKAPQRQPQTPAEMDTLKIKKAWEVALAPVKGLPMTAIMMYMSGNSLQIFSIMMVWMAFKNPIMGLISTNQAFARFESETNRSQIVPIKLIYVAMQILALGVDWLAWESQREPIEFAIPAL